MTYRDSHKHRLRCESAIVYVASVTQHQTPINHKFDFLLALLLVSIPILAFASSHYSHLSLISIIFLLVPFLSHSFVSPRSVLMSPKQMVSKPLDAVLPGQMANEQPDQTHTKEVSALPFSREHRV